MRKGTDSLKYVLIIAFNLVAFSAFCQQETYIQSLKKQNTWVDSVFKKLSKRQKIAQFFFVRAHTNLGQAYEDSVAAIIKKQQVGGLVFFQGGPVRQAELINRYQKIAKVPLLIAQDGEWGLGMRLDSTISYPYQMTLGAIQDNTLIYKMGQQVALDFKRMGMQMNFGPDMDVNNNPDNPVINYRSFGDNKYNVAAKGIAYMKGMQDAGLLTTAKHFPGHGDTNVDSHFDLPLLPFSRARLDSLEEYPFREAIKAGISGIMIAHMAIPALDTTRNLPSTLSRNIVTNILKDSLGFKGLVVSDAMEMKGVVKYFPNGEADLRAFLAGDDVIELSPNSALAIKKIRKAVRKKEILPEEFEARVKKILAAKYWAGLNNYDETLIPNLVTDLNRTVAKALVQQLCDAAITLLKGDTTIQSLDSMAKTAIISIGVTKPTVFQNELSRHYKNSVVFLVGKNESPARLDSLERMFSLYPQIIVSVNDTRLRPQSKLNYSDDVKAFIARLATQKNSVISVFANAYTIAGLPGIEKAGALIVAYQINDDLQLSAVKVMIHQLKPSGKLPVKINDVFASGAGIAL